jgi:hypothetical protein
MTAVRSRLTQVFFKLTAVILRLTGVILRRMAGPGRSGERYQANRKTLSGKEISRRFDGERAGRVNLVLPTSRSWSIKPSRGKRS